VRYERLASASASCDEHVRAVLAFIGLGDCDIGPCSQLVTNRNSADEYLRPLTAEEKEICDEYVGKFDLPIKLL
jgi:hypothetical protein